MAYQELARGATRQAIINGSVQPRRALGPRQHFWDGGAMGPRPWPFAILGPLLTIACIVLASVIFGALVALGALFVLGSDFFVRVSQMTETQFVQMLDGVMRGELGLWATGLVFASVAIWLPCVWLVARVIQRWPFGKIISTARRVRWRLFALAGLVGALTWLGMVVFDTTLGFMVERELPAFGGFSWTWLWALLFVAPFVVAQSSAEEVIFRAYLPQCMHHFLPQFLKQPFLIAVVCSAIFAGLHWGNSDVMFSPWIAMVEFFALSMLISWLSLRLGGVEPAMALHAINNCMLLLVFSAEQFTMGDHVLLTVPIAEGFGDQWYHWLIQAGHLGLTVGLFWVIGMWRASPLSLVAEAERQGWSIQGGDKLLDDVPNAAEIWARVSR